MHTTERVLTDDQLRAEQKKIDQARRCIQSDSVALQQAKDQVRRFEIAIEADEEDIRISQKKINDHWSELASITQP